MPVFHTLASKSNAPTAAAALTRLQGALEKLCAKSGGLRDFERFEREAHAVFVEVEREVLAEELERLDVDLPYVLIDGRVHHRVLRCKTCYTSAAGPIEVERTLYRAGTEKAVVPLELNAGIIEGQWTPLAARQMSWVVAHLSPQEGESLFRELGGMQPSKSSLDRLPKRLSARWEAGREGFEAALRAGQAVPEEAVTLAISLDGVMVPMKDGERTEKREQARVQGKHVQGPAGYQEVGCGTLSFYDAEGEYLDSLRFARMPESKKATLKETQRAEVEAILGQRPDLTVVKLADGAHDNWSYLGTAFPQGVEVVDFFHAAEQLKAAFDAAYGERSPKAQAQFEKYRHLLREDGDGVSKVIRALVHLHRTHPRRRRIAQVLGYFRRHRHRMRYTETAEKNLPIGSGVVEAACRTLATQRLKRSGMRWRHPGGQAILTLRALIQSRRFEQAWEMLSQTYHADVTPPDNVVAIPRRRLH